MARTFAARPGPSPRPQTGICIRREYTDTHGNRKTCTKAVSKERQTPIGLFVCSECGARLVPSAPPRGPLRWIIAGVVILLLLAGGGAYWFGLYGSAWGWVSGGNQPPPSVSCVINEKLDRKMANMKPAEITELAERCFSQGDYYNAVPAYFTAARAGDAKAMAGVARMYDPVRFQRDKPFASPNPREAAEWYQKAAAAGAPVQDDREKLRAWLANKARNNDKDAAEILGKFWK